LIVEVEPPAGGHVDTPRGRRQRAGERAVPIGVGDMCVGLDLAERQVQRRVGHPAPACVVMARATPSSRLIFGRYSRCSRSGDPTRVWTPVGAVGSVWNSGM